ncbi:hypothetical protein HPB49_012881 [Dermacentor silvarum]|uniref:Uncharacterized protein n=1 Tax=Dermacentor silvarum TaxID=543639 RepID=A0ACB8C9E8_DERSI|nr:hypothetical protein HPB49_012881 [Dermacentor silvarum]
MAAATQRGYDAVAVAWTQVDVQRAATTENGLSNIEDEGLFQLVNLRRKATQRKMASKGGVPAAPLMSKPAAGNPSGLVSNGNLGAAFAQYVGGEAGTTLNVWPLWTQNLIVSGTQHVETANKLARDFNLNMGSGSVPLRGHVKLNGKVCRGVITCGTVGHRIDNCPHPDMARCGSCGQRVGASEQGLAEHECTPSCMVCGEAHLTGSADCNGKFRRLQRPRSQQQEAPSNKTTKPTDNGGAPSVKSGKATAPATGSKAARENSAGNKTSSCKENKNRKTSWQSAKPPAFQEGDFPPLGNSKAAITFKVSNWAEIASTPSSSPSPLELELKKEIAFLQTQN